MKWKLMLHLERRKLRRHQRRDSAMRFLIATALILIIYVGFAETVGNSPIWHQIDKGMHFLVFGFFAFASIQFVEQKEVINFREPYRSALSFGALYCLSFFSELSQIYLPKRHFEWNDILANMAGITVFGGVSLIVFRRREGLSRPRAFRSPPKAKLEGYVRSQSPTKKRPR